MYNTQQSQFSHGAFAVLIVLFFAISAFAQMNSSSSSELVITSQPVAISIVPINQSATLSFVAEKGDDDVSYQWYQSIDGTTKKRNKIEGASDNSYVTEIFTDREIRYYFCIATSGKKSVTSKIAVVAYTGLPVLYINTEVPIASITKDAYVFGDMKLVYENGEEFIYEFNKEKDGEKKEGIKGRGNSSWRQPKKAYSIKFDEKKSFFGLPEAKKWCIIASYTDKTLLRNKLASELGNEIFNSDWNPHFRSIDVVWNGEYQGNYIFAERNTINAGRVEVQDISDYTQKNIDKAKYTDQNGDGEIDLYDGGFILEIDEWKDSPFWFTTEKEGAPVALKDPDEVSEEIQNHVKNIVQTAENVLYGNDFTDPEQGWRKYFDENSAIDWYMVNEIARNTDAQSFSSIYKYYSPSEGKIHYGPIWDFDNAFGNQGDNGKLPEEGITTGWYITKGIWTKRMFEDSAFVANVKKRWNEKKEALDEMVSTSFQSLADTNAISAECNFKVWKILGKHVSPNPAGAKDRKTYQSEVDYMKNWLKERIAWLDNALQKSFFISYNLDGGILAEANAKVFLSQGTSAFTLNTPTKEGFVFGGWSGTGIEGVLKNVVVTDDGKGDRVFTANWGQGIDIAASDIEISESEFVYDGTEKEPSIVVRDGENTLSLNTDYNVSYIDNVDAGTAKIIVTGIGSYAGIQEKEFTISPKPVVLTVTEASKTYGDEDPELEYTVEGMVSVDGVTDELTGVVLVRESGEDAGEYAITVTIDADANPNYTVTPNEGLFTIKPDSTEIIVSVTGHSDSLEFNGQMQSVSGFEMTPSNNNYSLESVSFTGDSLAAGTDVQSYAMGLSANDFKNTSINFPNVVFDVTDGSLVVTPKQVVLTVTAASKTYGDKDPALKYSVDGLVTINGVEDKLKNITLARKTGEDAGDYAVSATIDAKSNPNYTVKAKDGKFTITPKQVVLTVAGASKTYGDKDPALEYSVEGLVTVNGVDDKLKNVTLARKAGENVGEYAITATVDAKSNPNYTVKKKDGKFTITPNTTKVVVTVKGHNDTVEYNGKKQTVHGFDMASNNKAYSLSFVRYTGDSLASGTKVNTYSMGLSAEDFKNTSANYSNVVFEITDGSLTIEKQKKKDALIASREDASHLKVSVVHRNVQIYSTMVGERFTVFDVQGIVVQKGFVESANFEIPVAKPGIYMVRVGTSTQRICIK